MPSEKKRKTEGEVYPIFAKKSKASIEGASNDRFLDAEDGDSELDVGAKLSALRGILDFSGVDSEEEISRRFERISTALLQEFRLVVRRENVTDVEFEILEAEFYLQIGGCHEDPFTHGNEEQRVSGRWYFHRAPMFSKDSHRSLTSTSQYRGGSRKGMDLTFGGPRILPSASTSSQERLLRGGILLRSVRKVNDGQVTSGPSLLVDKILSTSAASGIQELVDDKWGKNTSAFFSEGESPATCLFLKPVNPKKKPPTIYFSPRIGLDLSHPGTTGHGTVPLHPRIQFLPRRYRFFVHPEWLTANGRSQTFLGVLSPFVSSSSSYSAGLKKSSLAKSIAGLTGIKEVTAAKYLGDYVAGREAGLQLIDSFIGEKGKGASSSPATYLKMMGALSNMESR